MAIFSGTGGLVVIQLGKNRFSLRATHYRMDIGPIPKLGCFLSAKVGPGAKQPRIPAQFITTYTQARPNRDITWRR